MDTLRDQLSFGLKSTVQLVVALLNFRFYLYALIFFVDTKAAGEFSVALLFVEVVRFAPNALGLVLFPALTRVSEHDALDAFMARASRNLMLVTTLTVVVGVVVVPVITELVFGPEYANIVAGTRIMLVAAAFGVGYQVFSRYFTSRHLQSYNIFFNCLGLLMALICSAILMPRLGFEGAAWAFLVGNATCGIAMVAAFLRLTGRPVTEVLLVTGADLIHMRNSMRRLLTGVF